MEMEADTACAPENRAFLASSTPNWPKQTACNALDLWLGPLLGSWSLLDVAASGYGRYLLLRNTSSASPARQSSSARLIRTLSSAAIATSNKVIALELGVSNATVSEDLAKGLAALGLESRIELIRLMRGDALTRVPFGFRVRVEEAQGARWAVLAIPVGFELLGTPFAPGPNAILRGLLEGKTTEAIAALRGTSLATIFNQIAHVSNLLQVSSRYEIVRAATLWTRVLPLPEQLPPTIQERFAKRAVGLIFERLAECTPEKR